MIALEHEAQILGYLKSSRLQHRVLINFGSPKFEIRKFVWSEAANSMQTQPQKTEKIFSL
jgi:hypothetical protein